MHPRVELVYFEGCPHAPEAIVRLTAALARVGMPGVWQEWDTLSAQTPERYRRFGSPTILVNGHDVLGDGRGDGKGAGEGGGSGMRCVVGGGPSIDAIVAALQGALSRPAL